ncbi:MAG: PilN domain-containing protein [Pseudomonadota bacterium]
MQQINLFKFVKLPIKSVIDGKLLLSLYGIFFGFLMLVFLISIFQNHRLRVAETNLKDSVEAKRKELVSLATLYPTSIPTQILDATRLPLCNIKFSNYLASFSQAYVSGIWLTNISISKNGEEISLKGHALRALEVHQFLLQLKQQNLFANLSFDILQMKDQPPPLSFEIVGRSAAHG